MIQYAKLRNQYQSWDWLLYQRGLMNVIKITPTWLNLSSWIFKYSGIISYLLVWLASPLLVISWCKGNHRFMSFLIHVFIVVHDGTETIWSLYLYVNVFIEGIPLTYIQCTIKPWTLTLYTETRTMMIPPASSHVAALTPPRRWGLAARPVSWKYFPA